MTIRVTCEINRGVFLFAGNGNGPPSDLEWGEMGNYGPHSELGPYIGNNEGSRNYDELKSHTDVEPYKVPAEDNNSREKKGKCPLTFKQFRNNMNGGNRKSVFKKWKRM